MMRVAVVGASMLLGACSGQGFVSAEQSEPAPEADAMPAGVGGAPIVAQDAQSLNGSGGAKLGTGGAQATGGRSASASGGASTGGFAAGAGGIPYITQGGASTGGAPMGLGGMMQGSGGASATGGASGAAGSSATCANEAFIWGCATSYASPCSGTTSCTQASGWGACRMCPGGCLRAIEASCPLGCMRDDASKCFVP